MSFRIMRLAFFLYSDTKRKKENSASNTVNGRPYEGKFLSCIDTDLARSFHVDPTPLIRSIRTSYSSQFSPLTTGPQPSPLLFGL
jgi:hypothetical protein